ncbi:Pex19 protein [Cinara cedri]|uniref:Peroxin-19 n=1 Tax=Cinara cedri TaxID=506608 RepID=A0A5E4MNI7_9HEMI|nr:Pex19 protein [Cinara cedri]
MSENQPRNVGSETEFSYTMDIASKLHEDLDLTEKIKVRDFLQAFLKEIPEESMQKYINSDQHKILIHKLRLVIDKNNDILIGIQEIFQKILLKSILDLPEPNYLTAMCANMNIQDDFDFEKYTFMLPIFKAFCLAFFVELYIPIIKNLCDNYPKWLDENEPVLSNDEFYKHALAFENVKAIRDYFENQHDTHNEIDKQHEIEDIEHLFMDMNLCGINIIPDHLYYCKTNKNQSNDLLE